MKKSILKSLQPQTKSLFKFNNSDSKSKFNAPDTVNTDASITTTVVVTQ